MGSSYIVMVGVLLSVMMVATILGKPVVREKPHPDTQENEANKGRQEETGLAYDNYLRQVVDVLESDPGFRKKLETANISDIKNGNIAMHLEMVNHTIRTALDELKRQEVNRLQDLIRLDLQGTSGIDLIMNAMYRGNHMGRKKFDLPSHLDLKNPHSFEMSDLKTLILQTTADLEALDKKREAEFKEYEMEKEYERNKHLSELSEEDRKKEKARLEALKKKHADHPKLNHPGSKDQFEEVWEKGDHLEGQDFNPRTFFFKHDLNGDLEWTIDEVDALVQIELDKVYDPRNSPDEDDPLEREAEMGRMRKHIFEEMDEDKNLRITLQEFFKYTGPQGDDPNFKIDEGWKTIDEEQVFSEDDYLKFLDSHHGQPDDSEPSKDLKFHSEQGHRKQAPGDQHGQQNFQQQQFNQQQQLNQQHQQINQQHQNVNYQQQPQFNQQQQQPQFNQQQQQPQFNQQQQQPQFNQQQQPQFNQQQQPQFNQQPEQNINQQQHVNQQQQPQFNQQHQQIHQQQQEVNPQQQQEVNPQQQQEVNPQQQQEVNPQQQQEQPHFNQVIDSHDQQRQQAQHP